MSKKRKEDEAAEIILGDDLEAEMELLSRGTRNPETAAAIVAATARIDESIRMSNRSQQSGESALRVALEKALPGLPASVVDTLVGAATIGAYGTGDEVAARSRQLADHMLLIVTGALKVSLKLPKQGIRCLPRVLSAEFLPLFHVDSRVEITAHIPSTVAFIPRDALQAVVEALPPGSAARFWISTWTHATSLIDTGYSVAPLAKRLIDVFLRFARDFGRPEGEHIVIDVPITHAELAGFVGGSRAAVTRAMGKLREQGLVTPGADRRFKLRGATASAGETTGIATNTPSVAEQLTIRDARTRSEHS